MSRMTDEEWELAQDRNLGDGPEPGDEFGSAPLPLPERTTRSGPNIPEAQRGGGNLTRLQVRITKEQRRRLAWIQEQDGHDLSTIIGTYIDTEWDERAEERRKR